MHLGEHLQILVCLDLREDVAERHCLRVGRQEIIEGGDGFQCGIYFCVNERELIRELDENTFFAARSLLKLIRCASIMRTNLSQKL